jgi:hypothetical protein
MKRPATLDIQDVVELLRAQPKGAQQGAYSRVATWLACEAVDAEDRRMARNVGVKLAYYRKHMKR